MEKTASRDRTVAVIDDDESVRLAIRSLLRSLGFRVDAFASGEDLLRAVPLPIGDPACLIVDVRMPGMSGLDLHRRLIAAGRRLPTIFISACHDPVERQRAIADGALAFL